MLPQDILVLNTVHSALEALLSHILQVRAQQVSPALRGLLARVARVQVVLPRNLCRPPDDIPNDLVRNPEVKWQRTAHVGLNQAWERVDKGDLGVDACKALRGNRVVSGRGLEHGHKTVACLELEVRQVEGGGLAIAGRKDRQHARGLAGVRGALDQVHHVVDKGPAGVVVERHGLVQPLACFLAGLVQKSALGLREQVDFGLVLLEHVCELFGLTHEREVLLQERDLGTRVQFQDLGAHGGAALLVAANDVDGGVYSRFGKAVGELLADSAGAAGEHAYGVGHGFLGERDIGFLHNRVRNRHDGYRN